MNLQKTLKQQLKFSGIGVHSGLPSSITLVPAQAHTGIVFQNANNASQRFQVGTVVPEVAMHATVIKTEGWYVSTIEHVLAALRILDVDNVIVEVQGHEIPILDGSALPFVQELIDGGFEEFGEPQKYLTPRETLEFADEQGRVIEIVPFGYPSIHFAAQNTSLDTTPTGVTRDERGLVTADSGNKISVRGECFMSFANKTYRTMNTLSISYTAKFNHPLAGKTDFAGDITSEFFIKQIAPARTFGFLEQLPFLRQHKLAQGSSLSNTIVIGDEILNDLRFPDECIRHKVLDLCGDLGLLPHRLVGSVIACNTSHNFNRLVVEHYRKNPDFWIEL